MKMMEKPTPIYDSEGSSGDMDEVERIYRASL